jgi:hypothetical protein
MKDKPDSFDKDLQALKDKYPMVWIDAVTPEDVFSYCDGAPDNWNDPLYVEVTQRIQSKFDSEFGLSIIDVQEAFEDESRK